MLWLMRKKCDRCGAFYIPIPLSVARENLTDPSGKVKYYVSTYGGADHMRTVDLCPSCYISLVNWLNNKDKEA